MVFGTFALVLTAVGLIGPGNAPQRYRMDVTLKNEADLTALGMTSQVGEAKATYWLSITTTDTTGGKIVHAVIDSISVTSTGVLDEQPGSGYHASDADSARGQFVHAFIVDGRTKNPPVPSKPTPLITMAAEAIKLLYPGVRANATTGTTWADTTTSDVVNEAGSQNAQIVTTWTVTGTEGGALVLTGAATGTSSGEQGPNSFSGTVNSTIHTTSVPGGPATKAMVESKQSVSYLIPQAPDPIPVKVETSATLVAIP